MIRQVQVLYNANVEKIKRICSVEQIQIPQYSNRNMTDNEACSTNPSPSCLFEKVAMNSSMLEVYGGDQGMIPSHGGLTPPSCPTKLSVKMEVTFCSTAAKILP